MFLFYKNRLTKNLLLHNLLKFSVQIGYIYIPQPVMTVQKLEKNLASRVQWKESVANKYLFIDFQGCTEEERIDISDIAINIIKKEDLNSVHLLVDLNNTTVSIESMRLVKKDWVMVAPNISRTAMLGVKGFKSMLLKLWGNMMPFKSKPFATSEEAINYLCHRS